MTDQERGSEASCPSRASPQPACSRCLPFSHPHSPEAPGRPRWLRVKEASAPSADETKRNGVRVGEAGTSCVLGTPHPGHWALVCPQRGTHTAPWPPAEGRCLTAPESPAYCSLSGLSCSSVRASTPRDVLPAGGQRAPELSLGHTCRTVSNSKMETETGVQGDGVTFSATDFLSVPFELKCVHAGARDVAHPRTALIRHPRTF